MVDYDIEILYNQIGYHSDCRDPIWRKCYRSVGERVCDVNSARNNLGMQTNLTWQQLENGWVINAKVCPILWGNWLFEQLWYIFYSTWGGDEKVWLIAYIAPPTLVAKEVTEKSD